MGSWMVGAEVGGGVGRLWSRSFGCGRPVILQQFLQSLSFVILFIDRVWTFLLRSIGLATVEIPQVQFFLERCRARVVQRQCRGLDSAENCGVAAVAVLVGLFETVQKTVDVLQLQVIDVVVVQFLDKVLGSRQC